MGMGAQVDRHVVNGDGKISAVVEIEAAQEILIGLAFPAVLRDRQAGGGFEEFARTCDWTSVEVVSTDGHLACEVWRRHGPCTCVGRSRDRGTCWCRLCRSRWCGRRCTARTSGRALGRGSLLWALRSHRDGRKSITVGGNGCRRFGGRRRRHRRRLALGLKRLRHGFDVRQGGGLRSHLTADATKRNYRELLAKDAGTSNDMHPPLRLPALQPTSNKSVSAAAISAFSKTAEI